jgi:hypothetical protein
LTRILRRIEQVRQGTAYLELRDADGHPCAGISFSAEQQSHEFLFGGILPDLSHYAETDRERCLIRAQEVFNQQFFECEELSRRLALEVVDLAGDDNSVMVSHLGKLRCRLDEFEREGRKLAVIVSGRTAGFCRPTITALPEREIGQRLVNLYTLCFSYPCVQGIVWTGFTDREPDVRDNGLLKADLSPKTAFQMLRKLVGVVWKTYVAGHTDATGRFRFHGFFGDYRIVTTAGRSSAQIIHYSLRSGKRGAEVDKPVVMLLQAKPGASGDAENRLPRGPGLHP